MTAMTQFEHRPATTAPLIVLFWGAAAALVMSVHLTLDSYSPLGAAVATIAVILLAAFGYTRLAVRNATLGHCLTVGTVWIVLAIVTELLMTESLGRRWYVVLGSPDRPLLRNILLFVWIFAPALFARQDDVE